MAEIILKAEKRTDFKKSDSKQLRKAGMIPGVYYVEGRNIPIKASELALRPIIFSTESHIVNLQLEGEDKTLSCILKDVQYDPIKTKPIHFDLLGLKEGETITMEITVQLNGTAAGVKDGGLVQHNLHKLEVECLPQNIPSHIDIDITNLTIGDSIKVSDIIIENVKILNDENASVVSVVPPTIEEAPVAEVTEEVAAEPEVISKGKKEEPEEEKKA